MAYPYSVYSGYGASMKTPEQLTMEYNNLMNNYQNLYRQMNQGVPMQQQPMQQSTQQPQSVSVAGDYKVVDKYSDVENTPTRLDGTATIFFDFNNMVFWSKKFVDGKHAIQSFTFAPLNDGSTETKDSSKNDSNNDIKSQQGEKKDDESILSQILDRLDRLENKGNTQGRKKVEDLNDELK